MKTIQSRMYYFGRRVSRVEGKLVRTGGDGWREALGEFNRVADDWHARRTLVCKPDSPAAVQNHHPFSEARS